VIIAKFALATSGVELTYARWFVGGVIPGIVSLLLVVYVIYRIYPPEVTHTPRAAVFARDELSRMGPMSRDERIMLAVFVLTAGLWMTTTWHHTNYTLVALFGVCTLLLTNVLAWDDVLSDKAAWDTFIWYGGLVRMAEALGESGITRRFAEWSAGMTAGWTWGIALLVLLLIYFYAHYGFASITAHVTAMFIPFLVVMIAAGAPPALAVLVLAYASNLQASLTHTARPPLRSTSVHATSRSASGGVSGSRSHSSRRRSGGRWGLAWWRVLGWW